MCRSFADSSILYLKMLEGRYSFRTELNSPLPSHYELQVDRQFGNHCCLLSSNCFSCCPTCFLLAPWSVGCGSFALIAKTVAFQSAPRLLTNTDWTRYHTCKALLLQQRIATNELQKYFVVSVFSEPNSNLGIPTGAGNGYIIYHLFRPCGLTHFRSFPLHHVTHLLSNSGKQWFFIIIIDFHRNGKKFG